MEFYDFPETKINIFEPSDRNYFFRSFKYTYLCTYEEIRSVDMWKAFPERWVLVVYKRYAVVKNATIIYQNENFEDGQKAKGRYKEDGYAIICDEPKEYFIHSWNKYLVTHEISDDASFNSALNPTIYPNATVAVERAIELSKTNQNKYIIAQWFDELDRH